MLFILFVNFFIILLFKLSPENAEEYIDYLRSVGRLDEAAVRLAAVVNDESFVSKEGKSNYQVRFYYLSIMYYQYYVCIIHYFPFL